MLKAQILDTDDFLPLRPSGTLVLSMCMVLSGVFPSMQEKNDVSSCVIFNATLLDFTVK